MTERERFLAAYDAQLRGETETPGAIRVERLAELRLVTFGGGRGFITAGNPGDAGAGFAALVPTALAHFASDPAITRVEWKTRGHDRTPGLLEALLAHGFEPEEPESIMIGRAEALAVEVALPEGVWLRQVWDAVDVRAMARMQDEVFGDSMAEEIATATLARIARGDGLELWVAEAMTAEGPVVVSAGRMEPVPGTDFAGLWGGATRAEYRGRGIYRALTAERARSAIRRGKTLINSDSTDYSRPILERSGFLAVSTTTPYEWKREPQAGRGLASDSEQ